MLIATAGYRLMVVVPVAQALLSPGTGRLLGLALMLLIYCYAVGVVWRNRKQVSEGMRAYAQQSAAPVFGTLLQILSRIWLWVALAYLTVFFVLSQADQQNDTDMDHSTYCVLTRLRNHPG